jgi:hypothetical protein
MPACVQDFSCPLVFEQVVLCCGHMWKHIHPSMTPVESTEWPRGISNPTGTACHLSSALIVLYYCVPPVRNAVKALAAAPHSDPSNDINTNSINSNNNLIHALGCLMLAMGGDADGSCTIDNNKNASGVDPTWCYEAVQNTLQLSPYQMGDAVTALVKILAYLRRETKKSSSLSTSTAVWNDCIDAGRIHSVFTSSSHSSDQQQLQETNVRIQITKSRDMPVPFPVSASCLNMGSSTNEDATTTTLTDLIQQQLGPQLVKDYQWPSTSNESNDNTTPCNDSSHEDNNMNKSRNHRTATRTWHVDQLPPIWMIHLDRFAWNNETCNVQPQNVIIQIPSTLSSSDFLSNTATNTSTAAAESRNLHPSSSSQQQQHDDDTYQLVGGILHVDGDDSAEPNDDDDTDHGGHYVSVVRHNGVWYCVDDDTVTPMRSESHVLHLLSGRAAWSGSTSSSRRMRGILLVYQQQRFFGLDNSSSWTKAQPHLQQSERSCDNAGWVGKRLQVQWAKGAWYSGVVVAFDPTTGRHTVRYDDGDVRTYQLRKKTMEWLPADVEREKEVVLPT